MLRFGKVHPSSSKFDECPTGPVSMRVFKWFLLLASGPVFSQNEKPKKPSLGNEDQIEIEVLQLEAPKNKTGDGFNLKHDVQIGVGFQMTEETRYSQKVTDKNYSKSVVFPNQSDFLSRLFLLRKGESWSAQEGDELTPPDRVFVRVQGQRVHEFVKSLPDSENFNLRLGIIEKGGLLPGSRELMFSESVDPTSRKFRHDGSHIPLG